MAIISAHQPCSLCGSSDACSINEDGSKYCHSCSGYTAGTGATAAPKKPITSSNDFSNTLALLNTKTPTAIADRGISSATAATFGVVSAGDSVIYPYYKGEQLVAAKIRNPNKRFSTSGEWTAGGLFGQQKFSAGGKYITIVEGEYDALAAYQLTGSKYPVVSIKNGAASAVKDCKEAYEWLDSFDNVVICFDADSAGQEAAVECAALFSGKSRVVKHIGSYKDASDYLVANDYKGFEMAFWRAEQYVPDGIVAGGSLWDDVNTPMETSEVGYPFAGLNEITYGIRQAELVTVTAGSGLGKSQFIREVVWHVLNNTSHNIGLLFLEESVRRTALSLMSLHANKPYHLPTTVSTEEERKASFDAVLGEDRLFMLDHFGSTGVDNIVSRVRYMAKGLDCRYIFLDHVSIVVSAQANLDERKALDEIMTKLRMVVQETGISLFLVSHLKRPDKKGHEEGAATSLAQLRGSGSIAQLSDMVIGLERNGQADCPIARNTTSVRVLKNRFSGETGECSHLLFTKATGRMTETEVPNEEEAL